MKHIRILSLLCMVCMLLGSSVTAFAAARTPEVSMSLDKTGKQAEIKLAHADMMFYSAQITFRITPKSATYSMTELPKNSYGTVTADDGYVTVYLDSTELLNGSKELSLGTLKANKEMSIAKQADITLVDRSMRPVSYSNIKVTAKQSGSTSSSSGGSGGNTGTTILGGYPTQPPTQSGVQDTAQFADVSADHWAKDSIAYVTGKGLFEGVGEGKFEPNTQMTRAMYVTVLSRFGNKIGPKWNIVCNTPMQFADVEEGQWYSSAIAWAGGTGLVNGVGDNKFGPHEAVTREQIAVMTVNFAKQCGVQLPLNNEPIVFTDAADIHDWAKDAVEAAQRAGLLYGREHGEFAPQNTATRAEVAAILQRFAEQFN